jgi:hypothetical protein
VSHAPTLNVYTNADFRLGVRWRVGDDAVEMSQLVFTLGTTPPLVALVGDGVTLGNVGNEYQAFVLIPKEDLEDLEEQPVEYDIVATRTSDGVEQMLARGSAVILEGAGA